MKRVRKAAVITAVAVPAVPLALAGVTYVAGVVYAFSCFPGSPLKDRAFFALRWPHALWGFHQGMNGDLEAIPRNSTLRGFFGLDDPGNDPSPAASAASAPGNAVSSDAPAAFQPQRPGDNH